MLNTYDPAEVSRFMQAYAKRYSAGAFAMPTAKDLAAHPDRVRWWPGTVAVETVLRRHSRRHDFTGAPYTLPAGSSVITHIAREEGAEVPDLRNFDYVTAYVEDEALTESLTAAGRVRVATRVSASAELIAVWAHPGFGRELDPVDDVDLARFPDPAPTAAMREKVLAEVDAIDGWLDDFPLYSDGSWDAVSLRGYRPDDPSWGVKPAEMPEKWHADHPGCRDLRCDWTTLSARTPNLRALIEAVRWWGEFDRVRLMRMRGRPDRPARLARHTDITDRSAGTRPGQMVRFFIPLVTDPSVEMTVWGLDGRPTVRHLEPWGLYYADIRKPHAVVNPSGRDRIQLAVDVIVDDVVRRRIGGVFP